MSSEESARIAGDNSVAANLSTEIVDRTNAVSTELSRAQSSELSLTNRVSIETSRAESAEGVLQSNIDVEKGRIDAILDGSTVDLDQFAEVVAFVQSIDMTNDDALLNAVANINQNIDTTLYNIRLEVRGDTMGVGNVISTADAQYLNSIVTTSTTPQGFDYYTGDVNGSNDITISDVYGIFGRISGRFSTWPSSVPDIKFFTVPEYTTIIGAPSTNYTSLIPGVTNFTYNILPGTPDSANFYVMVPGDVNGTGYHMARLTPIRINNPSNAPYHIIDETVEYDGVAQTIEIRLPELSVNEGNLVEVPVKVFTGANKLGALQLALKFDSDLLDFRRLTNGGKSMNWMSFINPQDGVIEWGGFDMTNGNNLLVDGETVFTFNFIAKAPQNTWNESPLYTTRKFVGDENAKDMNITPTNGLVAINRMGPGIKLKNNDMLVFPNPTTGEVIIQFNVEQDGDVDLSFVDGVGNNVINVLNRYLPNGTYSYTANLKDLSAGTYYTVLKTLTNTITNKTILIK
jgi:hypothetical protein